MRRLPPLNELGGASSRGMTVYTIDLLADSALSMAHWSVPWVSEIHVLTGGVFRVSSQTRIPWSRYV